MAVEPHFLLRLHLNSGTIIETIVDDEELEHHGADDIDQLVDQGLHQDGKPRWVTLGTVKFHPQAVCAIEIDEKGSTE